MGVEIDLYGNYKVFDTLTSQFQGHPRRVSRLVRVSETAGITIFFGFNFVNTRSIDLSGGTTARVVLESEPQANK